LGPDQRTLHGRLRHSERCQGALDFGVDAGGRSRAAAGRWANWESHPAIATCGEGPFLAGWQSLKDGTQWDITLRFLKADGTAEPTEFYAPFGISQSQFDNETAVDIACSHDGTEYFVV
jgi:hypothetical protein